jgi:hypothetical protein
MSLTPADFDLISDKDDGDRIFKNSKITRSRWRRNGEGPPFIKIGRQIFYRRDRLCDWLQAHEARSTAELRVRVRERDAANSSKHHNT